MASGSYERLDFARLGTLSSKSWFPGFDLLCAVISGAIWTSWPGAGPWPLAIALAPWLIRRAGKKVPFKRTILDFPLIIFLGTASIGVWLAYDREFGWFKFWILVGAVLLFYALAGQPQHNLWPTAVGIVLAGAVFAGFFLLVQDFQTQYSDYLVVGKAVQWWTALRPGLLTRDLSLNSVGGILACALPFTAAFGIHAWQGRRLGATLFALLAGGVMGFALLLTSSRGAWFALCLGLAAWMVWGLCGRIATRFHKSQALLFGWVVVGAGLVMTSLALRNLDKLIYLADHLPEVTDESSRLYLYLNTHYLVRDFLFTGGGLGAFSGLYSRYILGIQVLLFSYSHNLYLDVALEQGLLGVLAFFALVGGSIGLVVFGPLPENGKESALRGALLAGLVILCLHGLVDDALYGNSGTPVLLALPGLAVALLGDREYKTGAGAKIRREWRANYPKFLFGLSAAIILGSIVLAAFMGKPLKAAWLANLGATRMARQELYQFPDKSPDENFDAVRLHSALRLLQRSAALDPSNLTARYYLGLYDFHNRNFDLAQTQLEAAYKIDPRHRGIRKALGYCYVWSDQMDQAAIMLAAIPEAALELKYYSEWWITQDRPDLAERAAEMMARLRGYRL